MIAGTKSAAEGNVCRLSAASDEVALVLCKACRRQYHYRFNFAAGAVA